MIDMRAWTANAIRNYYLDPEIVFLDAAIASRVAPVSPKRDTPDCCGTFGGM
jgi:hypothetical protein